MDGPGFIRSGESLFLLKGGGIYLPSFVARAGSLTDGYPHTLGPRKEGVKSWDSLWFDPICSETQGKVPELEGRSFSLPPAPSLSSHELAPAGSPGLAGDSCRLYKCATLCPWRSHLCPVTWRLHCCGHILAQGTDGIKMHRPKPGRLSPLCRSPPAPLHWICKKCQSVPGTLPALQPTCSFLLLYLFLVISKELERMRFWCLGPAHCLDT